MAGAAPSRLLTAQTLGGVTGRNIAYQLGAAGERRVVAAIKAQVNPMLKSLGKAASEAGQQLADAHAVIGDNDLDDSEVVLRLGPEAARRWAEARDAPRPAQQDRHRVGCPRQPHPLLLERRG